MNKNKFLMVPGLICLSALSTFAQQKTESKKLNIVFILADDLGYSDLSPYGNPFNETPYLDSLAKTGVKFLQAYSACPVCSPSRASILTGKYPARLQLTNFIAGDRIDSSASILPAPWRKYLPSSEITIAEILKQNGYSTGIVGKWHLSNGNADSTSAYAQGFDYDRVICKNGLDYYNYSITTQGKTVFTDNGKNYITDKLTDYAVDFLEENKSKPFFLYLAYSAPHVVIVPKGEKLAKYFFKYNKFNGKYNPNYAAVVESLDEGVGRVVEKLKKEGLLENTLIIFTSDNGGVGLDELGPTPTNLEPLNKWKGHVYEGGVRVPLIVSWKGQIRENTITDNYITGTDFLPTLLDILGINKLPANVDGESFFQVLKNPEKPFERGPIFWHYPHFSNQLGRPAAAVRSGSYKLIEFYENGNLELYNLNKDISEKTNLASQLPDMTKKLYNLLNNWRYDVKANLPLPNPNYKFDKK